MMEVAHLRRLQKPKCITKGDISIQCLSFPPRPFSIHFNSLNLFCVNKLQFSVQTSSKKRSKSNILKNQLKQKILEEEQEGEDILEEEEEGVVYQNRVITTPTFKFLGVDPILRERLRKPLSNRSSLKNRTNIFGPLPVQEIIIPTLLNLKPTPLTPLSDCKFERDIVEATGKYDYKRLNPNHAKKFIVKAPTGQGKTLSFILPIVQQIFFSNTNQQNQTQDNSLKEISLKVKKRVEIEESNRFYPQAIILTPTKELCKQIRGEIFTLIPIEFERNVTILHPNMNKQALKECEILISTPAQLKEWTKESEINCGVIDLKRLHMLIVDECDYLSTGESKQILLDLLELAKSSTKLFFSATFGDEMQRLSKTEHFKGVSVIDVSRKAQKNLPQRIEHFSIQISEVDRLACLYRLLTVNQSPKVMLFVNKRKDAETISLQLSQLHFSVQVLHGDFSVRERQQRFGAFLHNRARILVCTDIACRGIDIPDCNLVISIRPPSHTMVSYVHRSGRTGRGDNVGKSILLYYKEDLPLVDLIESTFRISFTKQEIPTLEELNNSLVDIAKEKIYQASKYLGNQDLSKDAKEIVSGKTREEIIDLVASGLSVISGVDVPLNKSFEDLDIEFKRKIRKEEKFLEKEILTLKVKPHRLLYSRVLRNKLSNKRGQY